jgi:ABC-type glycerol-3-phosphate transport system substrate-binding protein
MNRSAGTWNRWWCPALACSLFVAWLILASACSGPASDESGGDGTAVASAPVRLLVVDDPPLAAAIRRQWAAQGTGELTVRQATSDELMESERPDADAIIYPSGLIGELAQRQWIVPVPDEVLQSETLAWNDVFRLLRLKEATWGDRTYGLPLGSPQLVLFYRADIFERLGLSPPQTWREYEQLLPRLSLGRPGAAETTDTANSTTDGSADTDSLNESASVEADSGESLPRFATVEPLTPGWAAQVLLARSASYARHRSQNSTLFDYRTMDPLIGSPPFVRALEEMVAAAKYGPDDPFAVTPADARRLIFGSDAAMALSWPTAAVDTRPTPPASGTAIPQDRAAEADESGEAAVAAKTDVIAFATLPGSSEVYHLRDDRWDERRSGESTRVPLLATAGRMGSVTRESGQSRAAFSVLVWLTGREWSRRVSSASSAATLFRATHLESPCAWLGPETDENAARQYAELVSSAQTGSIWLANLRLPGRREYLAALDRAVELAVREESEPADALKQAADKWNEITDRLGRDRQREAYQRSLGIAP